jgi:hypothetical protein
MGAATGIQHAPKRALGAEIYRRRSLLFTVSTVANVTTVPTTVGENTLPAVQLAHPTRQSLYKVKVLLHFNYVNFFITFLD